MVSRKSYYEEKGLSQFDLDAEFKVEYKWIHVVPAEKRAHNLLKCDSLSLPAVVVAAGHLHIAGAVWLGASLPATYT